ncbi:MAG: S8 family serine peptidase [Solirubrobacteraceae bacterium]|nr:S8 family serine peptidase [Solirubrobacteraceae bacterium]
MHPARPITRVARACALAASAAALATPSSALAAPATTSLPDLLSPGLRAAAAQAGSLQERLAAPFGDARPAGGHAPGEVIVTFHPSVGAPQRAASLRAVGARVIKDLGTDRQVLVALPNAVPTATGRDALERQGAVEDASLNASATLLATSNDPLLKDQYGLWSPAAGGFGSPDADIEATAAWDQSTGASVLVATVDSGMDLEHPDLAPQIAYNAAEMGGGKENDREDNDGNGYVDDWRGWDTGNDDNDPSAYGAGTANQHGTHVAGIIGARGNDGFGISGVAPGIRVLPVQVQIGGDRGAVSGPFVGDFLTADIVEGIHYAGKRGADVVNLSLGVFDAESMNAIAEAIVTYPNTLFVAAAGNSSQNRDVTALAPCTLPLSNVLCVGSSNDRGQISSFSDYGRKSVDLFAPGERVVSTVHNGEHIAMSGTSMATPVAAGAAAVYKSKNPGASPGQIKSALMSSTDPIKDATAKSVTGGRLNLAAALQVAPTPPTATVSVADGTLRYTGSGTTPHVATARIDGADIAVQSRAALTVTAPCTSVAGGARCPASGVTSIRMTGAAGNDRFVNDTTLPAALLGAAGADTLLGGTAGDTLSGDDGDDTLQGFAGGDTFNGGTGTDTVTYAERDAADVVNASLDAQRNDGVGSEADLIGGDVESVVGHTGPDVLSGGTGADRLYGLGGDDVLAGLGGSDVLDGGQGHDRVHYLSAPSAVTVNLAGAAPQATGGHGSDTLSAVEGVVGSTHNDTLTGDAGANTLDGYYGTDRLDGAAGSDWFEAAYATSLSIDLRVTGGQAAGATGQKTLVGIENVLGTDGADVLVGNAGANILAPGLGNDTVNGVSGDDTVNYSARGLVAQVPSGVSVSLATTAPQDIGSAGTETILNIDNIDDSPGRDVLTGTDGVNRFVLAGGDLDKVDGRAGTDRVELSRRQPTYKETTTTTSATDPTAPPASGATIGLKNVETTIGTPSKDVFVSGPGNDTFDGGPFTDKLSYADAPAGVRMSLGTTQAQSTGPAGTDAVAKVENLEGSLFNDTLTGSALRNVINPRAGADTVDAGGGSDLVMALDAESDTLVCGEGEDFITQDYGTLDIIDVSCEPKLRYIDE